MKEDRAIVESQLPALIKDVVPKNLGKLDEIAKENDGFLALGIVSKSKCSAVFFRF